MRFVSILLAAMVWTLSATASAPNEVPDVIDLDAIDAGANPCENFYQFACGRWLRELQLPADKDSYSHQSTALDDKTTENVWRLLLGLPSDHPLKLFFSSCENSKRTSDPAAFAFFQKKMSEIDAARTRSELSAVVARLHRAGVRVLFDFGSGQAFADATRVIGYLGQGGVSLPDRDYYLSRDKKFSEIRAAYLEHIQKQMETVNWGTENERRALAQLVLDFETRLAKAALPMEDAWDPTKVQHPVDLQSLQKSFASFDWRLYFDELGVQLGPDALNLNEPKFFKTLDQLLRNKSLKDLKSILKWNLLRRSAASLAGAAEEESFRFWEKTLQGQQTPEPVWKRCTDLTERRLSDALGEVFVSTIRDADLVKRETSSLIVAIEEEFAKNLDALDWLDAPTREEARAKLTLMNSKVAFPDRWRGLNGLVLKSGPLIENEWSALEFETRRQLQKIGRPVDRDEWGMAPWEINAYYDPSLNEIVFPYGTLQVPVFDLRASVGANMGALGATVGHELTHGFDDSGSQYDGRGNARDWWTPEIRKRFEERAQCLIEQADQYEVLRGLRVSGKQTLGENIADQGGTKLAYRAYRSRAHVPAAPVGGFSEEQQFFISYAQSWCTKRTEENLRMLVTSDSHPPEEYRVNGVLVNMPEFSRAFSCREGVDRMAPAKRCSVW
jgi:endothelin-converting enzyme/putative endopeptidase